jgi:hypothetical protein
VRVFFFSFFSPNGVSPTLGYIIILFGTLFVAVAQPFYLNMPSKLTTAWFAVKERDAAMTMSSMANPLGSALGTVLSPLFVSGEVLNELSNDIINWF